MSLTAEEIAMCRDALLEAGVPTGVIDRLLWTKDRLRRIRATGRLDERYGPFQDGLIESEKQDLYRRMVRYLIEEGIAEVKETRGFGEIVFSLDLTVLTPPGWKPSAKEPR